MNTAKQTTSPGPWMLTKIIHSNSTQYAVARAVGGCLEYVCSASGRPSSFKTLPAARYALRAAIAKAAEVSL